MNVRILLSSVCRQQSDVIERIVFMNSSFITYFMYAYIES